MSTLTESGLEQVDQMVQFFANGLRSPVCRRPSEVRLDYEDVFFPSMDGVTLEGWFIPANSKKVVICNRFTPGNRYGMLDTWKDSKTLEVSKNHGLSSQGNGRTMVIGTFEYRDVTGCINYIRATEDTRDMENAMISICLGLNSTIIAMKKHPQYFKDIKTLVGVQPISIKSFMEKFAEKIGLNEEEVCKAFDLKLRMANGIRLEDLSPLSYADGIVKPVKIFQVRKDNYNKIVDPQEIFNRFKSVDKEFEWIEGTEERFEGYNYFSKNPKQLLEWLSKYL